jgi:hypothetical protein
MPGIRFAIKRSTAVLMQFSAPHAKELQEPTLSTALGDAQDAWVLGDLDLQICYRDISHCVLRVALAARLAVNQGGECRLCGRFGRYRLVVIAGVV